MNNSVLIIGGAGFLGKEIAHILSVQDINCTIGDITDNNVEVDFKYIDILSYDNILNTCIGYDVIINCTGQMTQPIYNCFQLNTKGVENISKFCRGQNIKLIQLSSASVYGTAEYVNEASTPNPETVYASCKLFAEHIIKSIISKDKYIILRLSNLYGNNQPKGILAYLFRSFMSDKVLEFNNNGELKRYFLNVEDCASIISQLIVKPEISGMYNISGNDNYTVKEIIDMVETVINEKFEVHFNCKEPLGNIDRISDDKIRNILTVQHKNRLYDYIKSNFIKY